MQTDTSLFFYGFGIGLGIAVVGGMIDYWLSRRNNNPNQTRLLPGCMMYVAGILSIFLYKPLLPLQGNPGSEAVVHGMSGAPSESGEGA